MMKDEPAFPMVGSKPDRFYTHDSREFTTVVAEVFSTGGLSKRELFAAMAMQGFCANSFCAENLKSLQDSGATLPALSVAAADGLIAELEKK